ncbi:helix-turn-helix domain-containing protein [Virgibacillus proomii]|uniref:helix-turn-helix domain-containing protein n=1 Tax=Virgibacillus proomii TaxID=84407 RepID=UPI0009868A2D|nr:helix-turn-helix domain-containing protein [Virgibacillus proomii]
MEGIKRSYYAIIPATIRYDKNITANAKLLYGEITALCNEKGFCWARDSYFTELYGVSRSTIQRWFNQLEKNGYIRREVKYHEGTRNIEHRYTYLCDNPIPKNETTPIPKNETDNNTVNNNTVNNTKEYIRDLFDHYLSKNIIQHQKITSSMRSAINARLKDYTYEQLIQVIDNYAVVYSSDKYWFTQKYSLADLMRDKDVRKFIDDAEPLKNFAKRGVNNDGGFYQHRASNTRGNGKSTSYEQAKQELAAAEQAFRGGM